MTSGLLAMALDDLEWPWMVLDGLRLISEEECQE